MTSNDVQQYLTVDMFNSKMETLLTQIRLENEKLRSELHSEIQSVRSDLHAEILAVHSDVKVNSAQIAELHHFMYWGFALLTVVAAVIPFLRREIKEKAPEQKQSSLSEDRVKELIAQALNAGKTAM